MRKRDAIFLFGPTLILLAVYAVWNQSSSPGDGLQNDGSGQIAASDIRIIDGDTVEWQGVNYRLEGFDAPETRQADCEAERAMGEATASMLRSLILGAEHIEMRVRLGTDKYGRGIARLLADGSDVGTRLISQDLARPYEGGARLTWCD